MNQQDGAQPKRKILPPNLVAFLTGVILALVIGMIFRKIIDQMLPQKTKTVMKAQASEPQLTSVSQLDTENKKTISVSSPPKPDSAPSAAIVPDMVPNSPQKAEEQSNNSNNSQKSEKPKEEANNQPLKGPTEDSKKGSELTENMQNSPKIDEETIVETSADEVEYTSWRRQFRNFEERLSSQGVKNLNVTMTPRYRHQAKGLAITRGQFLDVVSKRIPTSLPTRQSNLGIIIHALSPADFDPSKFTTLAQENSSQVLDLCGSEKTPLNLEGLERITILLNNTPQNFKCLQNLLELNPDLTKIQEISLIGFTRGPTFYASLSSHKKLLSLQMWNPDWLLDNTVGLEETGNETATLRRSLRLANVTRALAQPSDVRMQIPASYRSLEGPLIEPRYPTPPKPLVVGNFALVPSHMPRGSLIATAFTKPGQDRSKSATVRPPGIGKTKALVLATQGKTLQFMSVTRE